MDFSLALVATPASRRDALLAATGLELTGRPDLEGKGPLSGVTQAEYFILWRNLDTASLLPEPCYGKFSQSAPLLILQVIDEVGEEVLRYMEDGAEVWSVCFHEDDYELISVSGPVPVDVAALRSRARAEWLERHPEDAEADDADLLVAYGAHIPARVFFEITGVWYADGPPEGLVHLSGDLPTQHHGWHII